MTKNLVVTLRLPTDLYAEIQRISKSEDIPMSFVIRRALKKGLAFGSTTQTAKAVTPADASKTEEISESWE
jgi:predicted transcriptional regulator